MYPFILVFSFSWFCYGNISNLTIPIGQEDRCFFFQIFFSFLQQNVFGGNFFFFGLPYVNPTSLCANFWGKIFHILDFTKLKKKKNPEEDRFSLEICYSLKMKI